MSANRRNGWVKSSLPFTTTRAGRSPPRRLVDAAGNDVINPRNGQPLIVPRDYDVNAVIDFGTSLRLPRLPFNENAVIDFGTSLRLPRLPFNEDLVARELVRTYESMYKAFRHGGPQDLQRSYNGMVGGGADEFVSDFKDAASFNLGVIGRAAGLSLMKSRQEGGYSTGGIIAPIPASTRRDRFSTIRTISR